MVNDVSALSGVSSSNLMVILDSVLLLWGQRVFSASKMTYIVSSGALNSTHSTNRVLICRNYEFCRKHAHLFKL